MKQTSIMRKLYNSKAFWLVIALLASLSLWIYVISQETEAYKQTFRGVRVQLVGETLESTCMPMPAVWAETSEARYRAALATSSGLA